MNTETKPDSQMVTKQFWGLVTRHDMSYIDIHRITGLGNAQLARWNKFGAIHAPSNADDALVKLMQHLGVI